MAAPDIPSFLSVRDRWLTAGLLGIGLVTFAISASTTNLILAKLMTSLQVELYNAHWVITTFGIARTITIPALGWLSGRFGPRALYLIAIGGFCLGTLGSALAWDWTSLLFFRIVTGAAGGLIPPLAMAIFYQIFPPQQRGMALGLSLMGWSIGPAVGPLMGGYLLEFASWRTIYVAILPMGGLGFILAWLFLPPLKRPAARRLDYYGLLSMSIAVTCFLIALSQGRREGWDSQYIMTLLTVAVVGGLTFILIELLHPEPLVELRLFRSVPFVMAVCVMCLTTMAFRSTGPMFPVLMQRILHFEPLLVAWTMMPSQIIYGLAVLATGRLSDKLSPQVLVLGGLTIYAATFVGYAGINMWTTAFTMTTFLTFRFIAEGLIVSPNNLTALRALPESQVMMASGLIGLVRSVSNTLGPAMAAVFWDQRFGRHLQAYAESSPIDSVGFTTALQHFQQTLAWMGETAARIPPMAMGLMSRLLQTEASIAAWQDYLIFNALLATLAILPAALANPHVWRIFRRQPIPQQPPIPSPEPAETPPRRPVSAAATTHAASQHGNTSSTSPSPGTPAAPR